VVEQASAWTACFGLVAGDYKLEEVSG
jgi:hypothetical protein